MSRSILIATLVLLGSFGCSQRNEPVALQVEFDQAEWRYRGRPGLQLRSPHYTIYTTITQPELVAWLPQTMESAFAYYSTLIPAGKQPSEPMPIYLFAARQEFEDFTRRTFGEERAALLNQVRGGGYMEKGVTVIEYTNHDATFPIMTHEGFHQYLHHYATSNAPAWLNEGLATLCEGQRWGSDGLRAFDKWLNPIRRNRLAEALLRDDLFPLSQLLRINAGHVVGGSRRKINTYYAQVWALVLYLQEGADARYAGDLELMLQQLGQGDLRAYARTAHATSSSHQRYNFGRDAFGAFVDEDLAMFEHDFIRFMRERILNEPPSGENENG